MFVIIIYLFLTESILIFIPHISPLLSTFPQIKEGNYKLVEKFDVKKRNYIGTTTMDAELSLIIANQAMARSGTLVFDPFAGEKR